MLRSPARSRVQTKLFVATGDTFTRADSSSGLGTASDGVPWTARSGVFGISSNQAYLVSDAGGLDGVSGVTRAHAPNVQDVSVQVVRPAGGFGGCGLVFGFVDNNNFYYLEYNSVTGSNEIRKCVAGVRTVLGGGGGHAGTTTVRVKYNRTTGDIDTYQQGGSVAVFSVNDTSLAGGAHVGLRAGSNFASNGGTFANFVLA